jgi:hypothetical protein
MEIDDCKPVASKGKQFGRAPANALSASCDDCDAAVRARDPGTHQHIIAEA